MQDNASLHIEFITDNDIIAKSEYEFDRIIFDLDSKIDLLSSQVDKYDYLISVASGVLCALLDILWVGEFSLERGRNIASEKIDDLVTKTAKLLGCKDSDLQNSVKFLEDRFPIPSDGNASVFGAGLQHHLRDFAHHPTIVGLIFSLLTQFTYKAYGTDVNGHFLIVEVPDKSKKFIGENTPSKILFGTITWFFHLISDIAGSNSTVGRSGGTGIPGPIISLAKELSALPFFESLKIDDNLLHIFLSKLFNGTLLAKHDEFGAIIKDTALRFDFRGELGVGIELGRQAIPVVANECIVRAFYFIRSFAVKISANNVRSFSDIENIDWLEVKPIDNPTIARMLTISTGVFTTIDISEAVISQKCWVSINYIGVGRFAIAIGEDISWCLKARKVKRIQQMYKDMKRFSFSNSDKKIYERIGRDIDIDKLGLTIEQTEILYNLEYYKVLNDIQNTKLLVNNDDIKQLKQAWIDEWKKYITGGFASFLQVEGAEIHWYNDEKELIQRVEENEPHNTWFRLVLLEAMLFEPYYPLSFEKDKKGDDIPSRKYREIQNIISGYKKDVGDRYLDLVFYGDYYTKGYINRLRKCYDKVLRELNEVLKSVLTSVSVTAAVAIVAIATAGAFAPAIAVALVGSNFVGLSGAALTSACLAYLGGGAIAIGGLGMAGGTAAVVGGGAILGIGVGAGVGGAVGTHSLMSKQNTIIQSAKLLVSVREIFLNDEHDVPYSNSVYEKYVRNIMDIEKGLVELRIKADVASGKEKKELKDKIKEAQESVAAMKIARKSLLKFKTSFEEGLEIQQTIE